MGEAKAKRRARCPQTLPEEGIKMADETTTTADETKRTPLPKTIADVQAITHIPTTEATASFARFINKYLTNADNFEGVTEEQAWTVIGVHRVWQQSEERKAEIAELKEAKAAETEQKRQDREQKRQEREAEKARKAEEKKAREAKKAAEKAAADDSSEDLDAVDEEGSGPIETPKRKRRPRAKAAEEASAETADEPVEETAAL
ncbi:hypothetical protein SEA_LITTLEFELLA_60 [Gordonia phage LittleFella]|nr:hypothetical protein SEA_LITTLEFELLA_60 [Gordonia phage LittleFella]